MVNTDHTDASSIHSEPSKTNKHFTAAVIMEHKSGLSEISLTKPQIWYKNSKMCNPEFKIPENSYLKTLYPKPQIIKFYIQMLAFNTLNSVLKL